MIACSHSHRLKGLWARGPIIWQDHLIRDLDWKSRREVFLAAGCVYVLVYNLNLSLSLTHPFSLSVYHSLKTASSRVL